MIAYDKTGAVFALTEGTDLLLHDGESEGPLWQTKLDGTIVGVGIDATQVAAVTAAGTVAWFAARTGGGARRTIALDARVQHATVDVGGDRIAAITDRGVLRVAAGEPTRIADDAGTCIALAPDGTVLVGTERELIAIGLDGTRRTCVVPSPVRAVAHHPGGFWLVGLAGKVLRWDGTASELVHVTNLPDGAKLDHLACSPRAIAISWDGNSVAVLAWPSRDTLGSLIYPERRVEGVAFGPWPWTGVALNLGDGNKFNLDTLALHRSDTHPGREHHRWLVSVGGPPDARRAPPRTAPPPAAATRSGSAPIGAVVLLAAIVIAIVMLVR